MMLNTPVQAAPARAALNAAALAQRAGRGAGAAGLGQGAWDDPSAWDVSTMAAGGSSTWERILAPVIPGTMNILTSVLTPPAYQTTTMPGGSQTTVRYPNVPSTIPGYPSTAIVPGTGITNTTLMIIAAAVVGLVLMSRGR